MQLSVKTNFKCLVACAAMAVTSSATAFEDPAFGVHLGTLGIGAHASTYVNRDFEIIGTLDYYNFEVEDIIDGADSSTGEVGGATAGLNLAYHPGGVPFRFTGGIVAGAPRLDMTANVTGTSFSEDYSGKIDLDLGPKSDVGAYLGVGVSAHTGTRQRVSFYGDLGMIMMGKGEADISVTANCGSLTNILAQDACQDDVDEAQADADELAADYNDSYMYPVLRLGVNVKF